MKSVKTIITACLFSISACAFADSQQQGQEMFATCPPATALRHADIGQPWTLDEKYSSQGWMVAQLPWANWTGVFGLSSQTLLSVRVSSDDVYLPAGDKKFSFREGMFSITCSYVFKDTQGKNQAVMVKSAYSADIHDLMGNEKSAFTYQNDLENTNGPQQPGQQYAPEANWGYVCNANALNPTACKVKVNNPAQPPMEEVTAAKQK